MRSSSLRRARSSVSSQPTQVSIDDDDRATRDAGNLAPWGSFVSLLVHEDSTDISRYDTRVSNFKSWRREDVTVKDCKIGEHTRGEAPRGVLVAIDAR